MKFLFPFILMLLVLWGNAAETGGHSHLKGPAAHRSSIVKFEQARGSKNGVLESARHTDDPALSVSVFRLPAPSLQPAEGVAVPADFAVAFYEDPECINKWQLSEARLRHRFSHAFPHHHFW